MPFVGCRPGEQPIPITPRGHRARRWESVDRNNSRKVRPFVGRWEPRNRPEEDSRAIIAQSFRHFSFIHSFVSIRRLLLSRQGGRTQPTTVVTNHVAHIRWPFKVQFYFSLNQPQDGLARKRGRCCTEMCRKCESNRLQWSVQSATGPGKFGEIIYIEI